MGEMIAKSDSSGIGEERGEHDFLSYGINQKAQIPAKIYALGYLW